MARHVDITMDGLHGLLHRLERKSLEDGDWAVCSALVLQLIMKKQGQQEKMAAKLSGGREKPGVVEGALVAKAAAPALPPAVGTGTEAETGAAEEAKPKGHGRQGASAFVNAKHFMHAFAEGVLGALCAACGVGRLTRYREKVVIRVIGQPLFAAEAHHLEQARCRKCGRVIRAEGPAGLLEGIGSSYVVYDASACAMLAVMHYDAATPFKRLESLHKGWGVPLADANLWDVIDEADDLLSPLYRALESFGVQQATTLRIDDTGSMVVEVARRIQATIEALEAVGASTRGVRRGINATCLLMETDEAQVVILFFTGLHHAGEVLDKVLRGRKAEGQRLVKVSDAASKNFSHQQCGLVEAACNAHAFLKFRDLKATHPDEYAVAGEAYKAVFDNDDEAKRRGLSPDERMRFHRQHSLPRLEKLRAMCIARLAGRLVEPNSARWEALCFIVNQWERLTRFCEVPGVPLDTNLVEQKLIIPVRYLAASFNYQTETGAEVGDRMMSLISSARANGVEPVAYLTHCLKHHEALKRRPADFLPWAYARGRPSTGAA